MHCCRLCSLSAPLLPPPPPAPLPPSPLQPWPSSSPSSPAALSYPHSAMVTVARQLPPYSASVLGNWPVAQWSAFARSSQLRRLLPPHVSVQPPLPPPPPLLTHTSSLLPLLGNTLRHLCLSGISLARVGRPRAALVLVGSRAPDATHYWISQKSCLYQRQHVLFYLMPMLIKKKKKSCLSFAGLWMNLPFKSEKNSFHQFALFPAALLPQEGLGTAKGLLPQPNESELIINYHSLFSRGHFLLTRSFVSSSRFSAAPVPWLLAEPLLRSGLRFFRSPAWFQKPWEEFASLIFFFSFFFRSFCRMIRSAANGSWCG